MITTLYVKYGSRITSGTAETLYDRVLADPQLAPFFTGVDVDKLREHMADVLGVMTGGPNIYKGRDLKAAHAPYPISMDDFNRVAAHLAASLSEMGIDQADITLVMTEVAKSAPDVVTVQA